MLPQGLDGFAESEESGPPDPPPSARHCNLLLTGLWTNGSKLPSRSSTLVPVATNAAIEEVAPPPCEEIDCARAEVEGARRPAHGRRIPIGAQRPRKHLSVPATWLVPAFRGQADEDFDANEIVAGLWVGSLSAAEREPALCIRSISRIVTVATRLKPMLPGCCSHVQVEIDDHPEADFLNALRQVVNAIDQILLEISCDSVSKDPPRQGVLVHCASGISRSAAACLGWIMMRCNKTFDEAFALAKAARPKINPNFGFVQALHLLEAHGGNIEVARRTWKSANDLDDRDAVVREFRKSANKFLARAEELERSLAGTGPLDAATNVLLQLQKELKCLEEEIAAALPSSTIDDSTARSVRLVASQKVARLRKSCERTVGHAEENHTTIHP